MAKQDKNTVSLPLEGMDSEHCALIIDKGLDSVSGIISHKVELNNKRAIIETNDPQETVAKAVETIRGLGYDVTTVKKNYPVLNMTCASCAVSSESMLKSQPGVVNVSVNYANATAQVEFIPTITDSHKLKAALQSVGYDLMIDESDDAKESLEEIHKEKYKQLRNRTIGAVALSVPLVIIGMFFM
ncbi:MAG: heavy metal translocating P-type ATPase, partial [Sphingobacteriales bacterium]